MADGYTFKNVTVDTGTDTFIEAEVRLDSGAFNVFQQIHGKRKGVFGAIVDASWVKFSHQPPTEELANLGTFFDFPFRVKVKAADSCQDVSIKFVNEGDAEKFGIALRKSQEAQASSSDRDNKDDEVQDQGQGCWPRPTSSLYPNLSSH